MSIQSLASIENKENGSTCPNCGEPLRITEHMNCQHTRLVIDGDCQNKACVLWMVTMEVSELTALTPERIQQYRVMQEGRRLREGLERIELFGIRP